MLRFQNQIKFKMKIKSTFPSLQEQNCTCPDKGNVKYKIKLIGNKEKLSW